MCVNEKRQRKRLWKLSSTAQVSVILFPHCYAVKPFHTREREREEREMGRRGEEESTHLVELKQSRFGAIHVHFHHSPSLALFSFLSLRQTEMGSDITCAGYG